MSDIRLTIKENCKKYRLDYTRYADDLTFSTNADFISVEKDFFSEIKVEIERAGFHMNDRKQEYRIIIIDKMLPV